MNLSRKWLSEFVDLPLTEVDDRSFAEAMTVSGSKVEVTEDLSRRLKNVVVGRVLTMEPGTSTRATWSPWPWTARCCPPALRSAAAPSGASAPRACSAP